MRLNRTNREYMYQLDPIPNDGESPIERPDEIRGRDQYVENRKLSPVRSTTVIPMCGRIKTSGADIVDDSLQSTRTPTTTLHHAVTHARGHCRSPT